MRISVFLKLHKVSCLSKLHKTSGKMLGQARQASFAGEDWLKTGKRNGPLESCLVGLLAGLVVILPHLTGTTQMCICLASLPSIAGLTDKYGPWNELYRARPALVRL